MPRLEIRLSVGEAAELDRLRGDVPKATFIKRRLGLGVEQEARGSAARTEVPVVSAPPVSRPPAESRVPEIDGVVRGSELKVAYQCRDWMCSFRAPSPNARCPRHAGPLKPIDA